MTSGDAAGDSPGHSGIRIFEDAAQLARGAAEEFARRAAEAVKAAGRFSVALSGGSTPRALYSILAVDEAFRAQAPWERCHLFWGDERPVPPDDPQSNYRMAWKEQLSRLPIPSEQVHRIQGENPDPAAAAAEYEQTLRDHFHPPQGAAPSFDLILLGLGADGHTASLFPGSPALKESRRWVVSNRVRRIGADRITLTFPVLNAAAAVIFLVSGEEKAAVLKEVLEGPHDPDRFPAQGVHPRRGTLLWLTDRPAARLLANR